MIEALDYVLCEGKEGSGGGVVWPKAVLGRGDWEEGKLWEEKAF